MNLEPGSFRDKANRVFYKDGKVFRAISQTARDNFELLLTKSFFDKCLGDRKIARTRISLEETPPPEVHRHWAGVLEHERIPFVSYPYEWSFSMLKDAALLQLELIERALAETMILKDASPYNVQWVGAQPIFIDIPSIVAWPEGEPWVGYRQFCELFLNPLLLQAHRNIPFQPWLRSSLDGIPSDVCARLLRGDFYKKGVLVDVLAHAMIQRRYAGTTQTIRKDLSGGGFHKELIFSNIKRLTKLVRGLTWKAPKSVWSDYATDNSYTQKDARAKRSFVENVLRQKRWPMVWDLGANTGEFSRLAAEHADYVVSVDSDPQVVEALYLNAKKANLTNLLPLLINLADPSPGLGWLSTERKPFVERGQPQLLICLALIHHLCITANIPMIEFVHWLWKFDTTLVIEFVTRDDPMTQTLLRNKDNNHDDYDQDVFEAILDGMFITQRRETLASGHRTLYHCTPRKRH